jgi:hypothetical protein
LTFSNKSANISRRRSENHIAKTCTAQGIAVHLTNLVKILHGTNISEDTVNKQIIVSTNAL